MIDPELLSDPVEDVSASMVRQFAILWLFFFGAIAARELLWRGAMMKGVALTVVGVSIPFLAAVKPATVAQLFTGLTMLTRPIGEFVFRLLLAVIYFIVFTPLAFVLRAVGHDPLSRRRKRMDTYWLDKRQPEDPRNYFRQA